MITNDAVVLAWSCPDCWAPSGVECDEQCPSAAVQLVEQVEAELAETGCHRDAIAAAADGCYCLGTSGRAAA